MRNDAKPDVERPTVVQAQREVAYSEEQIGIKVLFANEYLAGVVLGLRPGQQVALHSHEHKDEVFDVVAGEGEIYVGDGWLPAGPGTMVHVPPMVCHGLRNNGAGCWIVRETARERIYARTALRLMMRAVAKRWQRAWHSAVVAGVSAGQSRK